MNGDALGEKGRWTIAALGAVAIVTPLLFLFRVPAPASPSNGRQPAPAAIKLARPDEADPLLKEETELRDVRPLFLPTERNAAIPDPRIEVGRTFLEADSLKPTPGGASADGDKAAAANLTVDVSANLPPVVTLNGKPMEDVRPIDALTPDVTSRGFGRGPVESEALRPRGGFVEVRASTNGQRVLAVELPLAARPPGDKPWGPVEFLAVVDAAGLASPLVVTESSRVEEVDEHFKNFLARTFRLGSRLDPGFYRIVVGP